MDRKEGRLYRQCLYFEGTHRVERERAAAHAATAVSTVCGGDGARQGKRIEAYFFLFGLLKRANSKER